MLDNLQAAGSTCPYTSSWPVGVHIDNISSLSGVPVMSAKGQLNFNALPQVKYVAMMAIWSKAGYSQNFGRRDEASDKFRNGECAMLTTDSREAADFRDVWGVELGVAMLPFHDDVMVVASTRWPMALRCGPVPGILRHTTGKRPVLWLGC